MHQELMTDGLDFTLVLSLLGHPMEELYVEKEKARVPISYTIIAPAANPPSYSIESCQCSCSHQAVSHQVLRK